MIALNRTRKIIPSLIAGLLVMAAACKPGPPPDAMIIIFASPSSVVLRNGKELPARPGFVLKQSDVLQTRNGSVDIQSRNGATVRLREFTTARIADLQGPTRGTTRLEIENGSLLARVQKTSRKTNFAVVTPTAIAGVRGTTFSVEVEDGRRPRVKVLEGKVAFRPRLPAAEKTTAPAGQEKAEVPGDELNELDRAMEAATVVLEAGQEASLKPALDNKLSELNATLSADKKDTSGVPAVKAALEEKAEPVRTQSKGVSRREEADLLMMVSVREDLLERAARAKETEKISPAIERDYEKSLDDSVEKVKRKLGSQNIKSEADLAREYRIIEKITLVDGETITGAVVAQAGNVMVIHSARGVVKKKKDELDYVDVIKR